MEFEIRTDLPARIKVGRKRANDVAASIAKAEDCAVWRVCAAVCDF